MNALKTSGFRGAEHKAFARTRTPHATTVSWVEDRSESLGVGRPRSCERGYQELVSAPPERPAEFHERGVLTNAATSLQILHGVALSGPDSGQLRSDHGATQLKAPPAARGPLGSDGTSLSGPASTRTPVGREANWPGSRFKTLKSPPRVTSPRPARFAPVPWAAGRPHRGRARVAVAGGVSLPGPSSRSGAMRRRRGRCRHRNIR